MEGDFYKGTGYIFDKFHEEITRQRFQEEYAGYQVTDGIYIMPALVGRLAPAEYRHIIYLDGYRAFGDGKHPTTKMCLFVLESFLSSLPAEERSLVKLLDAGTGTGILAIAAAKFGVQSIDAFDIDADSVESAQSNAALNGCSWIRMKEGGIADFSPGKVYDIVTANLLTDVIIKNAQSLHGFISAGGHMIASGISDMRSEEALEVLLGLGLSLRHRVNDGGWNCFFLCREK